MSNYLFIQSQDPFTEVRSGAQFDLAGRLAVAGHKVRMFLVQNAVTAARKGVRCAAFDTLLASGVAVAADALSLRQREISAEQLNESVNSAELDVVIQAMLDGDKVIWN